MIACLSEDSHGVCLVHHNHDGVLSAFSLNNSFYILHIYV